MNTLRGITWLLALQAIGEVLAHALTLPLPGPVVGLALLLGALNWPSVRDSVAAVADFLLSHLSLLFVPVGVGVMVHLDLLGRFGLRLGVVIVVSTAVGLAVTALVLRALLPASGVATTLQRGDAP